MSNGTPINERLAKIYSESELAKQDAEERGAELEALEVLFEELGYGDLKVETNIIEVDGVIFTALYDEEYFIPLSPSDLGAKHKFWHVDIQAHYRCPQCNEMLHSPPVKFRIGQNAGIEEMGGFSQQIIPVLQILKGAK